MLLCSRYGHFSGINRKVQLKYLKSREIRNSDGEEQHQQSALMLILKWGGELTTAGSAFAQDLMKKWNLYISEHKPVSNDSTLRQIMFYFRLHFRQSASRSTW